LGLAEGLREGSCLLERSEVIAGYGRALVKFWGSKSWLLWHHESLLLFHILGLCKQLLLLLLRLEKLRLESLALLGELLRLCRL